MAVQFSGTKGYVPKSDSSQLRIGNRGADGVGISPAEIIGIVHKTEITLTDTPIVLADNAGVVAYGSRKLYTFPVGVVKIIGAVVNLALTKSSAGVNADWDGDFALGTAAANNTATLLTTEQNIVPSTATPQAVSGATTATGSSIAAAPAALTDSSGGTANDTVESMADIALSTSNTYTDAAVNSAVNTVLAKIRNNFAEVTAKINALILLQSGGYGMLIDGHTSAGEVYLNILIDDADHNVNGTACNIIANGTITLVWQLINDF